VVRGGARCQDALNPAEAAGCDSAAERRVAVPGAPVESGLRRHG
jgi:hypothetical protein